VAAYIAVLLCGHNAKNFEFCTFFRMTITFS